MRFLSSLSIDLETWPHRATIHVRDHADAGYHGSRAVTLDALFAAIAAHRPAPPPTNGASLEDGCSYLARDLLRPDPLAPLYDDGS